MFFIQGSSVGGDSDSSDDDDDCEDYSYSSSESCCCGTDEVCDKCRDSDSFGSNSSVLSFSWDDCYSTSNGLYKKNDTDSPFVLAAKFGDLKLVQSLYEQSEDSEKQSVLNQARKWTEVQEKYGYDKQWDWFGDTALIAASRNCHLDVVKYLLLQGADPNLESCPYDDQYESAEKAAKSQLNRLKIGEVSDWKVKKCEQIIALLKEVSKIWPKSDFSSAHFDKERAKEFKLKPKLADDFMKQIKEAVEKVDLSD